MSVVMAVRGRTSSEVEAGCAGEASGEGTDGGGEVDGFSDRLEGGHFRQWLGVGYWSQFLRAQTLTTRIFPKVKQYSHNRYYHSSIPGTLYPNQPSPQLSRINKNTAHIIHFFIKYPTTL